MLRIELRRVGKATFSTEYLFSERTFSEKNELYGASGILPPEDSFVQVGAAS